jgi:hypothetical protein
MQTGRRLGSNASHGRTLAPIASPDHSCLRRVTTNQKLNRSTTTPAPIHQPVRSAEIQPCPPSGPINLHSLATFRPRRSTPRFPPSRLIRRLPARAVANSHSCEQWQASNNPKRTRSHGELLNRPAAVLRTSMSMSITIHVQSIRGVYFRTHPTVADSLFLRRRQTSR